MDMSSFLGGRRSVGVWNISSVHSGATSGSSAIWRAISSSVIAARRAKSGFFPDRASSAVLRTQRIGSLGSEPLLERFRFPGIGPPERDDSFDVGTPRGPSDEIHLCTESA